jgi:hypothetical protein
MSRLLRFSLLAAAISVPVYAQDTNAPSALPPALQDAIHRIVTGKQQPPILQLRAAAPACSVPLLEMHIDHPEQFTMRTAPSPTIADSMPRAHAPAPPCNEEAPAPAR